MAFTDVPVDAEDVTGLVCVQLCGGGGPAGRRLPLLSNRRLTGRRGAGAGVSGIWSSSRMTGGTLGDVAARGVCVEADAAGELLRKFASSSLTERCDLSAT